MLTQDMCQALTVKVEGKEGHERGLYGGVGVAGKDERKAGACVVGAQQLQHSGDSSSQVNRHRVKSQFRRVKMAMMMMMT